MKELNIIGISLIVLVLSGSLLIVHFQAYATGCYDRFIFNWFSLNDVLICLDSSSGGGGVTSLTSSNSAITVNATSGNVLLTPKYELLCQTSGSAITTITCSNIPNRDYLFATVETSIGGAGGSTMQIAVRFNGDSSAVYGWRRSLNGGADSSNFSQTDCRIYGNTNVNPADRIIFDMSIYNKNAGQQKTFFGMSSKSNVGGGAPDRVEFACDWRNTSAVISSITIFAGSGTSNFGEITLTVWGYD